MKTIVCITGGINYKPRAIKAVSFWLQASNKLLFNNFLFNVLNTQCTIQMNRVTNMVKLMRVARCNISSSTRYFIKKSLHNPFKPSLPDQTYDLTDHKDKGVKKNKMAAIVPRDTIKIYLLLFVLVLYSFLFRKIYLQICWGRNYY